MFCHKCGKEIETNWAFCKYCGTPASAEAPAPSGKPQIVIELNKETYNVEEPFIATVKFLKDSIPIEPSEKKITLKRPDGSVVDFTSSLSKIDVGVYGINTISAQPAGFRVLNVSATINGSVASASKQYSVRTRTLINRTVDKVILYMCTIFAVISIPLGIVAILDGNPNIVSFWFPFLIVGIICAIIADHIWKRANVNK